MTHDLISYLFAKHGLPVPIPEYQFHQTRKWRWDYAWPEHKIAVEIQGGLWTGGRHVQADGMHKDMEKWNAAAVLGWRILYITPKAAGTLLMLQLVKDCLKTSQSAELDEQKSDFAELVSELSKTSAELAALRGALRNCAIAASGGNTDQIAWIVEGALSARMENDK